ncbi:MAG: copper homeostasis protein CutC [Candidatus Korobacteraceae bacterium]
MGQILLEICCGSAEDAFEAACGGADRVELCSALYLGGLTPSLGSLLEVKQQTRIPVMAMNRPRQAGFCYSATEFAVMERDADLLLEHGADGIVFGTLNADGRVDIHRTRVLRNRIGARQAVFHRAFDVTPDPFRALEELIDLGITRVLTSGQKNGAPAGAALIKQLIDRARGRIEVLPGAGIGHDNVRQFVATTGSSQIHMTAFAEQQDTSTLGSPAIQFGHPAGPSESVYDRTDRELVRHVKEELLAI